MLRLACVTALGVVFAGGPAAAASFVFSTGAPDGQIATLSRPSTGGVVETETADDFVLTQVTQITSATFTGLVTGAGAPGTIGNVVVEIYRVFPEDSNTVRTPNVPTRANSPSDVAFDSRDSSGGLTVLESTLNPTFSAANSVINGINPNPNPFTGGEGAVTGAETQFSVTFTTPFLLDAGHYFFVPQVQVTGGNFLWLSAPRPISGAGTTPFLPDLQAWIRNAGLDPDWLRIGTDITHTGPFNMSFSLAGQTVPEPETWMLLIAGFGLAGAQLRRRRRPTVDGSRQAPGARRGRWLST